MELDFYVHVICIECGATFVILISCDVDSDILTSAHYFFLFLIFVFYFVFVLSSFILKKKPRISFKKKKTFPISLDSYCFLIFSFFLFFKPLLIFSCFPKFFSIYKKKSNTLSSPPSLAHQTCWFLKM